MNLLRILSKTGSIYMCTAFLGGSVYAMDSVLVEAEKPGTQEESMVDMRFLEKEAPLPTLPVALAASSCSITPNKNPQKGRQNQAHPKKTFDRTGLLYPEDIYAELIKYTIGQDRAMKSLATFTHEHLITVRMREAGMHQNIVWEKPNILLVGPTGCGKTSSLNILSGLLKTPFAVGNATEWTTQGFIGGKWQSLFEKLVANADALLKKTGKKVTRAEVIKKAEQGIVFIDEIDKLCSGGLEGLEVINRVQQELLPAIQGVKLTLENGDILNTANILFIAGGAFPGLIPSELSPAKSKVNLITPQKLEKYGMLPELAGRLCNIVTFSHLTKEDLKKIIITSKHSFLEQYKIKYKEAYDIDLTFAEGAIDYVAEVASKQQTGARAIHAMIFKVMEGKTFEIKKYVGNPLLIEEKTAVSVLKDFLDESLADSSHHLSMFS